MALEFIRNIHYFPIAAYADNIVEIKTDDTSTDEYRVIGIKVEFYKNGDFLMETYSPVFFQTAVFNMNKIHPSLLPYYNNPIVEKSVTGANLLPKDNQNIIYEKYKEVLANGEIGDIDTWGRYMIGSINSLENDTWDDTKGTFLTYNNNPRFVLSNGIIVISTLNKFADGVELRYTTDLETDQLLINIPNYRYISNINLNASEFSDAKYITFHSPDIYNTLTYYFDKKKYERTKTLYWLNPYGGWEQFDFIDYEKSTSLNKETYKRYEGRGGTYTTKSVNSNAETEFKLYARMLNDDYLDVLNSLIESPIVFDGEGNEIIVNDNDIEMDYDFEQMFISIKQAKDNKVIKF